MDPAGRLDPQPWMTAPPTRAVLAALTADGRPARFVGGCVRDAVAGRAVKDIDIATPEPPARVVDLLHAAGLRAVPTGIDHGTVTAVADGGAHFEITTLRHDVETFGRHARVAFTDDWAADAARRDFTMNALYADADGTLYDPTGGLKDLAAGRVRFVGSAEARIREDVLRLLRFYRFHAYYGRVAPDDDTVAACRALAPLVAGLSAERVWAELARLMLAPDPAATLDLMEAHGVLPHVIPEAGSRDPLRRLVELEATLPYPPDPIRRLAAVLDVDDAGARAFANRLRLSRFEGSRLHWIMVGVNRLVHRLDPHTARKLVYELGPENFSDILLVAWARGFEPDFEWRRLWEDSGWRPPKLPIGGKDAINLGVEPGPEIGRLVASAEKWWIEQDFGANDVQTRQAMFQAWALDHYTHRRKKIMKYELRRLVLEAKFSLEISEQDYKSVSNAMKFIRSTLGIEEKFDITMENYVDLETSIHGMAIHIMSFNDLDSETIKDSRRTASRKFLNFLSSAKMYIDGIRESPNIKSDILDLKIAEVSEKSSAFRIIREIRNYAQHRDLAVHVMSFGGSWERGESGEERLRYSVHPKMDVSVLKEDKIIKKRILVDLENLGDNIDIMPLIRKYMEDLGEINAEFRKVYSQGENNARSAVENLVERYKKETGDGSVLGLSAVHVDKNGAVSNAIHIYEDPMKEHERLRKKNGSNKNLGRRYVGW